jgi:signal transduction histidine kinase
MTITTPSPHDALDASAPAHPTALRRYGALWRTLPRELGFHALTMPIAITGFAITVTLFSAGAGTIVTLFIGVFLAIGALYVSRAFGVVELVRLEWAGRPRTERPVWAPAAPGFWGWIRSMLGSGHYWLYLLHTMIVNPVISLVTWTLMFVWVTVGLSSFTYWLTALLVPKSEYDYQFGPWSESSLLGWQTASGYPIGQALGLLAIGAVLLGTLPLVSRGFIHVHAVAARGLLAAFASDALRREIGDLTERRKAAAAAEGHSLRRLERDIHDGPQQRLVRLQMDLAAAERQLDSDPSKARDLIAEAMDQSKEALEELRSLSRGFAPPLLLDRGLVAAIESTADRSVVPVTVVDELAGARFAEDVERNAYFVATETLANVAKHSGATEATVRVWMTDEPSLIVSVFDNGHGGAQATAGHGLAGLGERLRGIGGTTTIDSPKGGPTTITAQLPLPSAPSAPSADA